MKKNSFWIKTSAMIGAVVVLFCVLLFLTKEYRQAIRGMSSVSYFNFNPVALLWMIVMVGVLAIGVLIWLAKMIFDREQLLTEAAMEVRKVTNNIHAGVVNYIPEGICKIVYASRGYYEIIGVDRTGLYEIYQNSLLGFIPPEYHGFFLDTASLELEGHAEETIQMHDCNGKRYWMHVTLSKGVHGGKDTVSAVFVDVSELKATEDKLRKEKERYRIVTEISDEVLFEYEYKKDVMVLSERFTELYGLDYIIEGFRKNLNSYMRRIHPDDRKVTVTQLLRTKRVGANDIQLRLQDVNGEYQWCRVLYRAICDENGGPYLAIGKISNINLFKKEIEQLERESKTDSLTGAYNKMATRDLIDDYIKAHPTGTHMLLLIDVDNFKKVNDTYGHQCGDEILTYVIQNLRDTYVSGEIIGRIGGDEFVVFIGDVKEKAQLLEKAQELHNLLHRPYRRGNQTIPVSASIGVAMYPEDGACYDELLYCADNALYEVKATQKGNFAIYSAKEK
ncbi:MAG: diguanylate cyclase [Lachnospiraceae bacterium]|nr:diguanylate cyclase [Lachnospiraceae bacterium]